ncbi:bipolar DNA helicase HerA [Nonlabens ulvanivorans]|uniref:Bipolar DNA helicase HerA n=1 Tax=Nonlabens ulvanivorans TaxID=906888 RepID=A0A081DE57_NONUL|nr:ATP-binding protein [Nonlabens ulvanivorans]GAK77203.1 bipolar DNA helicase HerA [Nonlabens ulvanivorans]
MNEILQKDSIFKVGKVISVEGRTIKIEVDKAKNSAHLLYQGKLLRNISVNGFVKITKGFTRIIGKVEGEFIIEDKQFSNKKYTNEKQKIKRILQVSLLGFFSPKGFERGIKELPLINNECFLLDLPEFEDVHNFVKKKDDPLILGTLTHENNQEIKVGVNDLFASHIGIFGNTGSGKSYTLAKIYRELFLKYIENNKFRDNAKFFFIDFNGEYVNDNVIIDKDYKNIYSLNTRTEKDKFPISEEQISDYNFWSLVLEATEKTQKPFLKRAIENDFLTQKIQDGDSLIEFVKSLILKIIDKNDDNVNIAQIIDLLSQLGDCLTNSNISQTVLDLRQNLHYNSTTHGFYIGTNNYDGVIPYVEELFGNIEFDEIEDDYLSKVRIRIILQFHHEIINGYSNIEHLSPLLKRTPPRLNDLRKVIVINEEDSDKNITVISLRDVSIQMRKMLPLLICKQLYEKKKEVNEKEKYLNIIIDEAHNILSSISQRESETWKDYRLETFEEIIKEGRKFGTFLTIASQRPSDISATIISQLHNFFLHRLINNNDIKAVERTVSYLDKLSFESLPILPTGTCILAGLSAQVPVMIDIGKIKPKSEPDNKTMLLIENWKDELD